MIHHMLGNTKGIALIWTAAFAIAALSFVALAVDLSFAYVVSNELKSVADAGALTAAGSYLGELRASVDEVGSAIDFDQIRTRVSATVSALVGRNRVLNMGVSGPVDIEIQFGRYTDNGQPYDGTQFVDLSGQIGLGESTLDQISAFRVLASRGRDSGNPVSFTFARVLGINDLSVTRESVSILAPRNFMLSIDTSGSMDDLSYFRPEGAIDFPPWAAEESYLIYPPAEDEPETPWFSPHSPSGDGPIVGFSTIRPQPLQVVLDSSYRFLERLIEQGTLGDSVGVNYFSEASVTKIPLISLTGNSMTNEFQPLLSNSILYANLEIGPEFDSFGDPFPPHFRLDPIFDFNFNTQQYDARIAIPHGHTNIGGAIDNSINTISSSVAGLTQSISVIILFTDGKPDCAPDVLGEAGAVVQCFGNNITPQQESRAREYVFERARAAITQGIYIYPISYGSLDDETLTLLDEIAILSGLTDGHFRAGSSTDVNEISDILNDIFNEIVELIPFVLVA